MHMYHIDWCKIATSKLNDDAKFRLLPLLLLSTVHMSFCLYKGKSNKRSKNLKMVKKVVKESLDGATFCT
jgi:hypothetical protein